MQILVIKAICKNKIKVNINADIMSYLPNPNYLYATEVATNVKHFDEYNNYYYCDKEQSDNLSGYDFYLIKTENDWKYGRLIQNEEPSI